MALCRIELLGGLRAYQGDREITRFRTYKTGALLAYLAYHQQQTHSRESLCDLFWTDYNLDDARNSLSKALSSLRQQLEPPGTPRDSVFLVDRMNVRLNPEHVDTDVREFEKIIKLAARANSEPEQYQFLTQALALYKGTLLPGYYEDWVVTEQVHLENLYFGAVKQATHLLEQNEDWEAALATARKAVSVDPLREESYLILMRLLASAGQSAEALRTYEQFEKQLEKQMGVKPSPTLQALADQLRAAPSEKTSEQPAKPQRSGFPSQAALFQNKPVSPPSASSLPTSGMAVCLLIEVMEGKRNSELRAAWAHHTGLIREMFRRHGGVEFDRQEAGTIALFGSAQDALSAAMAAQQAMSAKGFQALVESARMVLHTGHLSEEKSKKILKSGLLSFAAQLLMAGHGGQILCSEETAVLLRRELTLGVELKSLGAYRLTSEQEPERVFQVIYPEMPKREFEPLQAKPAYSGSLPLQTTRFFGREEELAALERLLHPATDPEEGARLVTLLGPGGSGKSRISVEVGRRLSDAYAGAVWFVPLQDARHSEEILHSALTALGLTCKPDADPLPVISDFLKAQPSLIILDNLEQLMPEGAGEVDRLLKSAPTVKIIASSRRKVAIQGEREFPLRPLPVPSEKEEPESSAFENLSAYPSIQLFIDRAQAVVPDFQLTAGNANTLSQICRQLEGLPLALELAAARVGVLSLTQILERLQQRLDLLVSRQRDAQSRHRTLREAIAWSYDLLDDQLRQFFAKLSVFSGGWTLECAEQILKEPMALDYLTDLVECSLVIADREEQSIRFRMLESLREFASEKLSEQESAFLRESHARYYLQRVEQLSGVQAEEKRSAVANPETQWMEQEHENLRTAMEWALAHNPEIAYRFGYALMFFWDVRGHWYEATRILKSCLDIPMPDERLLARVLNTAGTFKRKQGDFEAAIQRFEQVLEISRSLDIQKEMADALCGIGLCKQDLGDFRQAQSLLHQSAELYQTLQNLEGYILAVNGLGTLNAMQGNWVEARDYFSQSYQEILKTNDRVRMAATLNNLGVVARKQSDFEPAKEYFDKAWKINQETGNRGWQAINLLNIGNIEHDQGNYEQAEHYFLRAQSLFLEVGDHRHVAACILNLGNVAQGKGDLVGARDYYLKGLDHNQRMGMRFWESTCYEMLARILIQMDDLDQAEEYSQLAYAMNLEMENEEGRGLSLSTMATLAMRRQEVEKAAQLIKESILVLRPRVVNQELISGLFLICAIAMAKKQVDEAATFYCAAEHHSSVFGITMYTNNYQEQDREISRLKDILGDRFDHLRAECATLTLDEALDRALLYLDTV
ncbi:MAG: tetratricopeptide repeat protein [Fimbriimonadia bacterium]|nr:tetratricopeptide repeat protein [Fimbriimonadia bacterium]